MAFSHTVNQVISTPEGSLSQSVTSTGSGAQAVDDSVADSTTDTLVNVAFTLTALKCIYILSDQALSLETNATDHSGGDIIALQANVPLVWQSGGYLTNPFTQNVTKFYVTNTSGSTANFSVRILTDATP